MIFENSILEDDLAGFTHVPWDAQRILISGRLFKANLVREPNNQYDQFAIRVEVGGVKVGFVPRGKCRLAKVPGIASNNPMYGSAPGNKNEQLARCLDQGMKFSACVQWPMEWKNKEGRTCRRSTFKPEFLPNLYIFAEDYFPPLAEEFIAPPDFKTAVQFIDLGPVCYTEPNIDISWLGKLFYVTSIKKFGVWGGEENCVGNTESAINIVRFSTYRYLPFTIIEDADIDFSCLSIRIPDSYSDKIKVENAVIKSLEAVNGFHCGKYQSFYLGESK